MKTKLIFPKETGTTLSVDKDDHILVKYYAVKHNLKLVEATHLLLKKALAEELGIKLEDEKEHDTK